MPGSSKREQLDHEVRTSEPLPERELFSTKATFDAAKWLRSMSLGEMDNEFGRTFARCADEMERLRAIENAVTDVIDRAEERTDVLNDSTDFGSAMLRLQRKVRDA
jgi:hypothetical protein